MSLPLARNRPAGGWSLVELLAVLAVLSLVAGMLVPGVRHARQHARLVACGSQLRDLHTGLIGYVSSHRWRLPPFGFSDAEQDLTLSGHWGGWEQPADPDRVFRPSMQWLNLWALVREDRVLEDRLMCPGAAPPLRDGGASYFPHTRRMSTYCVRFPASEDLFRGAEPLTP